MNKKTIVIIMLVLIAIIIFLFSLVFYNLNIIKDIGDNTNTQVVRASENFEAVANNIVNTNSSDVKISPNALITFFKSYSGCGHTVKTREYVSDSMVNMNQEEFCNLYSDWKINKFTSSEIELSKNFSGECGEHFLVKSNNGYIDIYNIENNGDLNLYERTDISTIYLTADDIAELDKGVAIFGKENLNLYIENFE